MARLITHRGAKGPKFQDPGHYDKKDRDKIPREDFGDPDNDSFPIVVQKDVDDAAHLIGHAKDPEAVKKNIIEIAKRKGFKLPKEWAAQEEQVPSKQASSKQNVQDTLVNGHVAIKNRIVMRMLQKQAFDAAKTEKLLNAVATLTRDAEALNSAWDEEFLSTGYPFSKSFDEITRKLSEWHKILENKQQSDK